MNIYNNMILFGKFKIRRTVNVQGVFTEGLSALKMCFVVTVIFQTPVDSFQV
mgnify:CR=1 FL=1